MNSYGEADHANVRDAVVRMRRPWIVSYDDVPLVRKLYCQFRVRKLDLLHTARKARIGSEVLFFSEDAVIPSRALSLATIG
jgi:DNA adenine methylase